MVPDAPVAAAPGPASAGRPLRRGLLYIGQTGRTSMEPPSRRWIFFAHSTASAFESASIR